MIYSTTGAIPLKYRQLLVITTIMSLSLEGVRGTLQSDLLDVNLLWEPLGVGNYVSINVTIVCPTV